MAMIGRIGGGCRFSSLRLRLSCLPSSPIVSSIGAWVAAVTPLAPGPVAAAGLLESGSGAVPD
jgi:hypothetical protein